jgi:hypothetical protein
MQGLGSDLLQFMSRKIMLMGDAFTYSCVLLSDGKTLSVSGSSSTLNLFRRGAFHVHLNGGQDPSHRVRGKSRLRLRLGVWDDNDDCWQC